MLALIYLGVAVYLGDRLCRRFYRFVSVPHRWAAALLVGLLFSTWFTYLAALLCTGASRPLFWGNIIFFVAVTAGLSWRGWQKRLFKARSETQPELAPDLYLPRAQGSNIADWLVIGAYVVFVCWMMFASLTSSAGHLRIAHNEYSDFGPNTSIMQSFAVGHNFPTEYPPFSGDRIRYHFLFYFQAGNLEFLGLDPAWSLNLLSIVTLVAMLILVMVLGEVLFNSRAVGRVGSVLFFFFGSLSYIPYLNKQASVRAAANAIKNQRDFLPSIFPFRGELWGVWSLVNFLNQRHLASAIGILLLVLIFLVIRYRAVPKRRFVPAILAMAMAPFKRPVGEVASVEKNAEIANTEGSAEPQLNAEQEESPPASARAITPPESAMEEVVSVKKHGEAESREGSRESPPTAEQKESLAAPAVAATAITPPELAAQEAVTGRKSDEGGSREGSQESPPTAEQEKSSAAPAAPTTATRPPEPAAQEAISGGKNDEAESKEDSPESPLTPVQEKSSAAPAVAAMAIRPPERAAREVVGEGKNDEADSTEGSPESKLKAERKESPAENAESQDELDSHESEESEVASTSTLPIDSARSGETGPADTAMSGPGNTPFKVTPADLTVPESLPASAAETPPPPTSVDQPPTLPIVAEVSESPAPPREPFWSSVPGFVFSGLLLGLLPMWNSAVFVAAIAVLVVLFVLCPLRLQMIGLAITAGAIALPQIMYLTGGPGRASSPKLFHWGYTLDHPTALNVAKYLGFTFGFKWLVVALALVLATGLQRRIFVAISSLIAVTFLFQLTTEVLANQKFVHIFAIIVNLFVAYGLWRLWRLKLGPTTLPGKLAAVVLFILIIPGGIIDFFPIHNAYWSEVTFRNDRLIDWLTKETNPRAIFLTNHFVNHPLLMAGRRVFYGWPYFSWSAGYRAGERDRVYQQLWLERNPRALLKVLRQNNISYVVIDNGLRNGEFGKNLNESVYRKNLPVVFQDSGYDSIIIFKVPEGEALVSNVADKESKSEVEDTTTEVSMFVGGKGLGRGQFDWPRGIAADNKGNILVADTNNSRIQRFSPDGDFMAKIGQPGGGPGEFRGPAGVAVDPSGNIYVADVMNQRVQKLDPKGDFINQWRGPADGLLGPNDVSIGSDGAVYVVDGGHARIVKFDSDGNVLTFWGKPGQGDGQFDQITSVAVDGATNRVYVADPRNRRIGVFDSKGQFIANWSVQEWRLIENAWYFQDLIVDSNAGRLYATSTQTDEVLVFDLAGTKIASLKPQPPDKLEGASSLALLKNKLYVVSTFAAHISVIDLGIQNLPSTQPASKTRPTDR